MVEMTEAAIVVVPEFTYSIVKTECACCYSLQPCYDDCEAYICADHADCQQRQRENAQPMPIRLTDADIAGLLNRMETQQADMERLKRIEQAAIGFVQARDAFVSARGHSAPILRLIDDMDSAALALTVVLKGGK